MSSGDKMLINDLIYFETEVHYETRDLHNKIFKNTFNFSILFPNSLYPIEW